MPARKTPPHFTRPACPSLDLIKAAFCPLEFNAMRFREHPRYTDLAGDAGLDDLEVR